MIISLYREFHFTVKHLNTLFMPLSVCKVWWLTASSPAYGAHFPGSIPSRAYYLEIFLSFSFLFFYLIWSALTSLRRKLVSLGRIFGNKNAIFFISAQQRVLFTYISRRMVSCIFLSISQCSRKSRQVLVPQAYTTVQHGWLPSDRSLFSRQVAVPECANRVPYYYSL